MKPPPGRIQIASRRRHVKPSGMTASELARSAASDAAPPAGLDATARTLWFARAGHWDTAHDLCQDLPGTAGSWIHAYLHREEGDASNAAYWYARAGKPVPARHTTLDEEWQAMATELLG